MEQGRHSPREVTEDPTLLARYVERDPSTGEWRPSVEPVYDAEFDDFALRTPEGTGIVVGLDPHSAGLLQQMVEWIAAWAQREMPTDKTGLGMAAIALVGYRVKLAGILREREREGVRNQVHEANDARDVKPDPVRNMTGKVRTRAA
jgi:hypothetical protein